MLTFSRKTDQKMRPVELPSIVKEVLNFIRATLPANITIKSCSHGDDGYVLADSTQVTQVLMNLCSNAADAMRNEGGVLEVNLAEIRIDEDSTAYYMAMREYSSWMMKKPWWIWANRCFNGSAIRSRSALVPFRPWKPFAPVRISMIW